MSFELWLLPARLRIPRRTYCLVSHDRYRLPHLREIEGNELHFENKKSVLASGALTLAHQERGLVASVPQLR